MTAHLSYAVGSEVFVQGQACVITAQIDVDQVLVQFKHDGKTKAVNIVNLSASNDKTLSKPKVLEAIPDEDLEIAQSRFAAIEPLLGNVANRTTLLQSQAIKTEVSVKTLRRWLGAYSERYLLSDLTPDRRGKR